MEDLYPRVITYVRSTPWALHPPVMAVMLDLLRYRNGGGRLRRDEIVVRLGVKHRTRRADVKLYGPTGKLIAEVGRGQSMAATTAGQKSGSLVAVIGIYGLISQHASQLEDISGPGGTSVERIASRFRGAMNDPAVKAVVFDVDSPGGGVYGVPELAAELRGARGRKPMEAVANAQMASAAYYIASAADKVWVTDSGEAGSIGVYAAHVDLSKAYERLGEKWTLVPYGQNKTLGNPFEPLTPQARADMQKRVNEYGAAFDQAVAKARGKTAETVRRDFGQGLLFGASEATYLGLADGAATLDQVVGRLARAGGRAAANAYANEGRAAYIEAQHRAARVKARTL